MPLIYPTTPKSDLVEMLHGVAVADPYRWLEDVDSPASLDWIRGQNELTFAYLEQIPVRPRLKERLAALWDFEKRYTIYHKGERYFQLRNSGVQNQDVLYVMDSPWDAGRPLLDPNTFSPDGTQALNNWSISEDGEWLAYAVSQSGSDWQTWHIRNVSSGADLPEALEWSKFSDAGWLHDASGFFYNRYPAPEVGEAYQQANYNQELYFHRLGTPQAQDRLVYRRPDQPQWGFGAQVSDDGAYLLLSAWQGTDRRNRFFYAVLPEGQVVSSLSVVELIPELEASYQFIGNDGPIFYLLSDLDAPRRRILAIDVEHPERQHWRTLVPQGQDVLEAVHMVNEQFVCIYLHDAHELIRRFSLDGAALGEIALPAFGSVSYGYAATLAGKRSDREMFYLFHSFVHPLSVYCYDFASGASQAVFIPPLDFDFSPYETRQVFVPGKDGTPVPLFLVHKKGLALDGQNPTLLYGYGGFNISLTPVFATQRLAWLEMGGVFAQAVLRGGGEYGEQWHAAGMLANKQNVFDDFIACAEWLINQGITSPARLAIEGRSNGGLLVGACMTQRPELFGACLPAVGVMDMLRFHKFTIGWAWVSDYGSPEQPEQFKTLLAYSPYHNLQPGVRYPPSLVLTGDHDDRVVPGHSFKFAARLQECQAGEAPVLIRIQTKAGHGAGKPTALLIAEWADIYAFLVQHVGMRHPPGEP